MTIKMKRLPIMIMCCLLAASIPGIYATERTRTSKSVKQERKTTAGAIERTRKQISNNTAETRRQLNRLASLDAEIEKLNASIDLLKAKISASDAKIKSLDDSISAMEHDIKILREAYAENLRAMRSRRQTMSDLSFIFSSRNFTEAYKRYRYIQEFERWQKSKTEQISALADEISSRKQRVEEERRQQAENMSRLKKETESLDTSRNKTEKLVSELKRKGSSLKKALDEKQRQLKALDNELDKIIAEEERIAEENRRREEARKAEEARRLAEEAKRKEEEAKREEARKAAETGKKSSSTSEDKGAKADKQKETTAPQPKRKDSPATPHTSDMTAQGDFAHLNGSFASNKGKLPFPVTGSYKITSHFGLNRHHELNNVKINNSGIDIEVAPSSTARAIFDGEVSSVFRVNGYHNVVMLRHGSYLTVYAGIDTLSVKKGDKVKAGQAIGVIYSDPDDENRSILHFEIRKEREKLNPEEWVK